MASSRFLSSFRSFMAAIPHPRHVGVYLTNVPKNYNPASLEEGGWVRIYFRIRKTYLICRERIRRFRCFHVNNNTLTIEDPIDAAT